MCSGVLLKKCRTDGDRKRWKRRAFRLLGCSLAYADRAPVQPATAKVLANMDECVAEPCPEPPHSSPGWFAIAIRGATAGTVFVAAASEGERAEWLAALAAARGRPRAEVGGGVGEAGAAASRGTLLKMALVSSAVGRAVLKRLMPAEGRRLIAGLCAFAEARNPGLGREHERGILELAARIGVVVRGGQVPETVSLPRLHDETLAFCQDLLGNSRDIRLKARRDQQAAWAAEERGLAAAPAETLPVDMPELLRSSARVAQMWRQILAPFASAATVARLDRITDFYFAQARIEALLFDPAHRAHLVAIDAALQRLLER